MGLGLDTCHIPVNPIKPMTVTLWAVSKKRRPPSMIWSNLDTLAAFARRWAALNRATFCSGVSTNFGGIPPLPAPAPPGKGAVPAPAPTFAADTLEETGVENLGSAILELAWGVVGVNRVASETLRGVAFGGIGEIVAGKICL